MSEIENAFNILRKYIVLKTMPDFEVKDNKIMLTGKTIYYLDTYENITKEEYELLKSMGVKEIE